jgi:hypothetical protein
MRDNNGKDPFEEIFREKFNDFEFEPSKEAWAGIRAQIIDDNKYRFPFWYLPAAIVTGLMLTMLAWQWLGSPTNTTTTSKIITSQTPNQKNSSDFAGKAKESTPPVSFDLIKKQNLELNRLKSQSILMQTTKLDLQPRVDKSERLYADKISVISERGVVKNDPDGSPPLYSEVVVRPVLQESDLHKNTLEKSKKSNEDITISDKVVLELINPTDTQSEKVAQTPSLLTKNLAIKPIKSVVDILLPTIAIQPNATTVLAIDKAGQKDRKPTFYISVMPMYSYYSVKPYSYDNQLVKNVKLSNSLANSRLGLNFQLGAKWPISKKLSVRTAFNYTQLNENLNYQAQSINPISYNTQVVDNNSIAVTPVYQIKNLSSVTNWDMLGVGIDIQYQILQIKNTKHFISLGRDLNVILPSDGTKRLNGFVNLSYGINQKVGQGLVFTVEPTLNYSLRSQSDIHGLLNLQPYSMGLKFSLGIALK